MIDEETYRRQIQSKQGRHKIRRKGSNDKFVLAFGVHIGNGRFMYKIAEGKHKGLILWEEQVEFKEMEEK